LVGNALSRSGPPVREVLVFERDHGAADQLEACMRAAHSLKGAASIVGLTVGVRVAHAMEDCFVAAQQGRTTLGRAQIDPLLGGTDLLMRIAGTPETDLGTWAAERKPEVDGCLAVDTTRIGPCWDI